MALSKKQKSPRRHSYLRILIFCFSRGGRFRNYPKPQKNRNRTV
ncbi:hypothetical protein NEILACOT_04898 [Neisseria lactamica ATCC 23970]|uniref:Uncharacterized protein n=1 Tax=Neisseria lactamica ATCC 23970 TaxID=546265 RepID=D0WBH2_NEILA|nr:hypothetical protein NEILACOT_04898 [Neisseria lactamica ATCC 23970]